MRTSMLTERFTFPPAMNMTLGSLRSTAQSPETTPQSYPAADTASLWTTRAITPSMSLSGTR